MGKIITMRTVARLETFFLQIAFWVSLILGGLALLLTVSGLFSVLSYLVEQRTREIGVRMALGASSQKVTQLMLAQTTRPVVYGLIAGAGLAAALATAVIATPVARHLGDRARHRSGGLCRSLLVIIAACLLAAWIPATRAARVDPMRTLRQEYRSVAAAPGLVTTTPRRRHHEHGQGSPMSLECVTGLSARGRRGYGQAGPRSSCRSRTRPGR